MSLVKLGEFEPNHMTFGKIQTKSSKNNKFKYTTCSVGYASSDGSVGPLIFITPKCRTSGIWKSWPLSIDEDHRTDDNVDGFKMNINITTRETSDSPTDDEQKYLDQLDLIHKTAYNYIKQPKIIEFIEKKCPGPAKFLDSIDGLKRPYSLPFTKTNKNNIEINIPHSQFVKLVAYKNNKEGKGLDAWKFISRFRGPGNREVNPSKYIGVSGQAVLAIKLESIYFGAHQNNPIGASLQFKVYECNFTPRQIDQITSVLPANEDPVDMDIPDKFDILNMKDEDEDDEEKEPEENGTPQEPEVPKKVVRRRRVVNMSRT